ncbi:unnamed protein product [Natator depressus]
MEQEEDPCILDCQDAKERVIPREVGTAGDGIQSRTEKEHPVEGPEDLVLGILLLRHSAECFSQRVVCRRQHRLQCQKRKPMEDERETLNPLSLSFGRTPTLLMQQRPEKSKRPCTSYACTENLKEQRDLKSSENSNHM